MSNDKATVLVESYRRAATTKANENSYNALRIHALPGLHDFIATRAVEYFEPGAKLLDVAAGTGAMSSRMMDLGFEVTATDYVPENFKLKSVRFVKADLNNRFCSAYDHSFQAIIASEIIEHLENPRHFARECFKLLDAGGRMILLTPNPNNAASQASFVRSGNFLWFNDKDYESQGHITPLTQWQIVKAFSEAGFIFRWKGSFGENDSQIEGSPRLRLIARLLALISDNDPELSREIFVTVLEKPIN